MYLLYRLEPRTFGVVDARPRRWRWLDRLLGPRRAERTAWLARYQGRYASAGEARAAASAVGLYKVTTEDGVIVDQFPRLGLVA